MNIRVAIVEDNSEIREGLGVIINGSNGFHCVGTHADAEHALKRIHGEKPDVILMDIELPGMSGIECAQRLKHEDPDLQIMMLTVYKDDDKVFKSLAAGATGYVLKKTPPAELLDAIRELHEGGSPMSSEIARKVVQTFQDLGNSPGEAENLSDRELEILSHLAKGYRDREIGEQLFISRETVRTHLRNIYKKLHVRSRTEAVVRHLQK